MRKGKQAVKHYANCRPIVILSLIFFFSVLGWVEDAKTEETARGVITFDFPIPLKPQVESILDWIGPGKTQEAEGGVVTFNGPIPLKPKIEVNLDRELIAFVSKTTEYEPEIAELIAMLEGVYVRSYSGDAASFDPMIRYYERVLQKRGWEAFAKIKEDSEKIQIWVLLNIETIDGLFVMVTGETETHLVNIVGHLHPQRIDELLRNLEDLGVGIPQLNSLEDNSLQAHQDGFGNKERARPLEKQPDGATPSTIDQSSGNTGFSFPSTHFLDKKKQPINEVRIRGNQRVRDSEIREALEKGPDDIRNAIKTMEAILPYIRRTDWHIHKEGDKRIVTITVEEKIAAEEPVPDGIMNLSMSGRFNRVHGFRLGPRLELSKPPEVEIPLQPRLFGALSYGFSNKKLNYEAGGEARLLGGVNRNLILRFQFHRLTSVRDPDILLDDDEQLLTAFLYGGDFRDYYLREGSEISLRWQPEVFPHSLELAAVNENHESLTKTTDWSLFRWTSDKEENTPITPGQMRSIALRYDFDSRFDNEGWYNTFAVEHGNSAVGSDFDFTRFELHSRRYQPIGDRHMLDLRLKIGLSAKDLPVQRQFILGGPGSLRGYDLYEFAGNQGMLLNVEYRHHVTDYISDGAFVTFFIDAGQAWNKLDEVSISDPKINLGVGLLIGSNWKLNWAQALESGRTPQFNMRWSTMF